MSSSFEEAWIEAREIERAFKVDLLRRAEVEAERLGDGLALPDGVVLAFDSEDILKPEE